MNSVRFLSSVAVNATRAVYVATLSASDLIPYNAFILKPFTEVRA